ncbi:hypothetical protein [Thermomonas haemolytica]|uniref:Uncharacterized protein n=1 Tax=Thermomonas haemolytica TaxID=141949 RepID=A0A4R3NEL7_9GAMM|nr:hypothetical protein [Thermomonas haemolytica]TCT25683.1 hypothetical protein EDC34_1017 [Thermomonas haemolytica]TNY29764.1 hypothetical protein BV505_04000 [Thermomonas haemolytica]
MGIDVYWKDERGGILAALPDSNALAQMAGLLSRQTGSRCLQFIDPAGDTFFKQLQLPELSLELANLLPSVEQPRWREHLIQLHSLVERAVGVHTYVWFVGD